MFLIKAEAAGTLENGRFSDPIAAQNDGNLPVN